MQYHTETENQLYRSDDLLVCSFLLCNQARLVDVVSDSPRHFTFVFQDPTKCRQLVQEYVNGGTAVARELFSRREELLGLMRNRNGYRNETRYENVA